MRKARSRHPMQADEILVLVDRLAWRARHSLELPAAMATRKMGAGSALSSAVVDRSSFLFWRWAASRRLCSYNHQAAVHVMTTLHVGGASSGGWWCVCVLMGWCVRLVLVCVCVCVPSTGSVRVFLHSASLHRMELLGR